MQAKNQTVEGVTILALTIFHLILPIFSLPKQPFDQVVGVDIRGYLITLPKHQYFNDERPTFMLPKKSFSLQEAGSNMQ